MNMLAFASELQVTAMPDIYDLLCLLGLAAGFVMLFALLMQWFVRGWGQDAVADWRSLSSEDAGERNAARRELLRLSIITLVVVLGAFLTAGSFFIFQRIEPQSAVVTKDSQIGWVFEQAEHLPFWRLDKLKGTGGNVYSFSPKTILVEMTKTVSPHKTIRYTVECEVLGSIESLKQYIARVLSLGKDAANEISYNLYEFNKERESDFDRFYNPLDAAQQAEFQKLALEYLRPRLSGAGIVTRRVTFRIS